MTGTPWMGGAGAILFVAYLLAHPALDRAIVRNSPYAVIHVIGAAAMALIIGGMLGIASRAGRAWAGMGRSRTCWHWVAGCMKTKSYNK
ncbi:MAG TPA: hypothetical protein VKE41_19850 [Roseiflexaceae bacterium]|nr:hypothetical protein [Roseiflexaceae bacterium]